jgi:hypothetical protein
MKTRIFQPAFALVVISAAFGISAPGSAFAEYRCDHPQRVDDRRACEYAQQGPAALRRFVERTQSIYGLYFDDYIRPDAMTSAIADAGDRAVAVNEAEPARRADADAGSRVN